MSPPLAAFLFFGVLLVGSTGRFGGDGSVVLAACRYFSPSSEVLCFGFLARQAGRRGGEGGSLDGPLRENVLSHRTDHQSPLFMIYDI